MDYAIDVSSVILNGCQSMDSIRNAPGSSNATRWQSGTPPAISALPGYARLLAVVVAAYALSPVDLIPDFIPVLGYLDDLILIPAGIALTLRLIPPEVMADARSRAESSLAKPNPWWMTLLIILVWVGVLALLFHLLLPLFQNNGKIEATL